MLGDDQRLAILGDFIQQFQTLGFELSGRNRGFHQNLLWSLTIVLILTLNQSDRQYPATHGRSITLEYQNMPAKVGENL
jgi:hypothetical protein